MSQPTSASQLKAAVKGSSFYAGMRVLPKAEREAMYAIYGFCRIVDDIADDQQGDRTARAVQMQAWRDDIAALYAGGDPGQAGFLAEAVRTFALDQADFIAVIDGMQMDIDADIRWPSFETFDLYCDRVASAVGRLSVRVFGMEHEPGLALSHHLGRALQFTNILRDIDEDAAIGRVYLPIEALQSAGISPATPEALLAERKLDHAARWLLPKAKAHFAEAGTILAQRPKGHLIAPRLMEQAYSRLLQRMEAQGWQAPRHRISTNKPLLALTFFKLWLLG